MERDVVAINLLRDFVKEKLGGDINKLRTYNLKTLAEERKYGENYFERSPIVKAIMSLSFGDVWPGLSMDAINKGKFECDCINKYQNLFGINMCDQYFKGLQKFNPTPAQHQRALKVAHMSYSVGNLWVLPSSPSIASRVLDNRYRYYMDKFLLSIYNVLTDKKRPDKTLQSIIAKHKLMEAYKGEESFDRFVKDMMLEDFMDYNGKPTEIFPFVWSGMNDLSKDAYFDAVYLYCTFYEKFTPKRADRIIDQLSRVLAEAPAARQATRPVITTVRPKAEVEEKKEQNEVLNRYGLAYYLVTNTVEVAKNNTNLMLMLLADKEYYVTLTRKMGLTVEGFSWDDFSVRLESFGDDFLIIFYEFPKPLKEPEALYGAMLYDRRWATLTYYTLEKCSHPGRWALGMNAPESHSLMGMYDMEPSMENFFNLIVPKDKKPERLDVKAILNLPEKYQILKNFPKDPVDCVNYGIATTSSKCVIQVYPIGSREAMPFGDTKAIISGIHGTLADNQALVEVKSGKTAHGREFVYSIVKEKKEPSGVDYALLLHVDYQNSTICFNGFFMEYGTTGMRDATVFELAIRQGLVTGKEHEGWWLDPYDKDWKHPFLMNLSEQEQYDVHFPDHPLSQCRQFVKLITQKL